MASYKTEAIVLRLREYREADGLFTLLTREKGKVSGVARGIYKPAGKLRGGVQPYSINEMMLETGRTTLHTLIQSDCVEMLIPLRQNYEAMALAAYWAELLETFAQEELADEDLYQLAKAGFLALALNASLLMGKVLEVRLIEQQGLRPDFERCCLCGGLLGKPGPCLFSASDGGFICRACANGRGGYARVSPASAGLWQGLEKLSMDKLSRLSVTRRQTEELGELLRQWILRHSGKAMNAWPMISKLQD